jgi:hypothetical protein
VRNVEVGGGKGSRRPLHFEALVLSTAWQSAKDESDDGTLSDQPDWFRSFFFSNSRNSSGIGMEAKGGTCAPPVLPTGTQIHVKNKDPRILIIWPVISVKSRRLQPTMSIPQWALA